MSICSLPLLAGRGQMLKTLLVIVASCSLLLGVGCKSEAPAVPPKSDTQQVIETALGFIEAHRTGDTEEITLAHRKYAYYSDVFDSVESKNDLAFIFSMDPDTELGYDYPTITGLEAVIDIYLSCPDASGIRRDNAFRLMLKKVTSDRYDPERKLTYRKGEWRITRCYLSYSEMVEWGKHAR